MAKTLSINSVNVLHRKVGRLTIFAKRSCIYVAGHPIDEAWRASGFRNRSSVFRIQNKHGIKLNRGNHSRPIKKKKQRKDDQGW